MLDFYENGAIKTLKVLYIILLPQLKTAINI